MRSFSRNEANNLKSNQIQCIRSISGILKTASEAVKVASLSKKILANESFHLILDLSRNQAYLSFAVCAHFFYCSISFVAVVVDKPSD